MSSQADSGIGRNAVVCYFPDLPYYLRYQIGFDIIINPAEAHADPRAAGESHRVIHVELFFPNGFMSNPATFGGMPHPPAFERGAPHFLPQEQHHSRVFAHVSNGQLGEFMSIDDTPYYLTPQCNRCGEFHREAEHCHNQPPQYFPRNMPTQNPHNQPGHFRQLSSASGITDQRDMSHAAPFAPHFSPSRPAIYPPMYPDSHFNPHIPMVIEEHEIREERRRTRVLEIARNHQPQEFLMNEDTARFPIPQLNMRDEILRQPRDINNNPPQGLPSEMRRKRPRQSSQHPSTSGITDTDHRGQQQNEDKSYLTQPTEGEIQIMLPKSLQEIQRKNHNATSADNEPTDDGITHLMNLLDVDDEENEEIVPLLDVEDEKNEENVLKDNKKPGDDPNGNNDN